MGKRYPTLELLLHAPLLMSSVGIRTIRTNKSTMLINTIPHMVHLQHQTVFRHTLWGFKESEIAENPHFNAHCTAAQTGADS